MRISDGIRVDIIKNHREIPVIRQEPLCVRIRRYMSREPLDNDGRIAKNGSLRGESLLAALMRRIPLPVRGSSAVLSFVCPGIACAARRRLSWNIYTG